MKNFKQFWHRRVFVIIYLYACIELIGCGQEGPAEKAGAKVDAAEQAVERQVENVGEHIDKAVDKTETGIKAAQSSVADKSQATGEYLDDAVITSKIKIALLNDEFLKATQIGVTTVNGTVKLTGTVDSEQQLTRASNLVNGQGFVKSVENELVVKASVPSKL